MAPDDPARAEGFVSRLRRAGARLFLVSACGVLAACGVSPRPALGPVGEGALQASIRKDDVILRPDGPGPFPAVILLHGCGGLSGRGTLWAERLRAWGYLSLRVNSLAARGLKRVCGGGSLRPEERIPDVLAALAYLRTRPDVAGRQVALMGWSHGGSATLATLGNAPAEPAEGFRAAIAFYPSCRRIRPWRTKTPTLILIGEADDWTAPGPCLALVDRQRRAGLDVTRVTYPGAYHGFDNPLLGPNRRRVPDALGGRGATIQYDPAAADDSLVRVREFLSKHLTH